MRKRSKNRKKPQSFYEVTCCIGLERFVQRELRRVSPEHKLASNRSEGAVIFSIASNWKPLLGLKTVHDLFHVMPLDVPRPRSLLEPLKMRQIIEAISEIKRTQPALKSFRVSAAGADSKDIQRFREVLAKEAGLKEDPENGTLLIRLRRSLIIENGWDVLLRLVEKPLHVRPWRRADYRGALDATIARVMVELLNAKESAAVIDPMCGSGTLLVEQANYRKLKKMLGFDQSDEALKLAQKNMPSLALKSADIEKLPINDHEIDGILCNPPWGEAIGKREKLSTLYTQLLKESSRILKRGGRMCIIVENQETLLEAIKESSSRFSVLESHRVLQRKGFHPTIFLLESR